MSFYPFPLAGAASNIVTGGNPAYAAGDFLGRYPQFSNVDDAILQQFITMADATVFKNRWGVQWEWAMDMFVAHFATLYLQTQAGCSDSEKVIAAAQARGLVASESVDGVSISYDNAQAMAGISGWGSWKLTAFGQQYLTFARLFAKPGVYVW